MKQLWLAFAAVIVLSFAVLGWTGFRIYQEEGLVKFGFWATNVGLFAMVTLSLLPVGLMQTWASVEHGYWYARSPEFLQTGAIEMFRWLRVIGDTVFAAGAVALAIFVIGLRTGGSTGRREMHIGEPAAVGHQA